MIINNITNLLTYYMPTVHAYPKYDKISSGTIDDISSLNFIVGKHTYSIKVDSKGIYYHVYDNDTGNGHGYSANLKIDDPLTHAKLYTLYLECRQKAWENFLKDTEVPIPSSAEDGFAKLMD